MFEFVMEKKPKEENLNLKSLYDLIIIGSGPGGCSAALYAKRKNLNILLITENLGGKMVDSNNIENYLGILSTSGEKLNSKFLDHLYNHNIPILTDEKITQISKENNLFLLKLSDNTLLKSKTIIVATGSGPKKLNVLGEDKFAGIGVFYCAICDGPFYKNKDVLVVGGNSPALEIAIDLAKIAKTVTIIDKNKEFSGDDILIDKLKKLKNVHFIQNSIITEFSGGKRLEKVTFITKNTKEEKTLNIEGAFIHIGFFPNSNLVKNLVDINTKGEIITNLLQETSLKGLYAVGDVTDTPFKQILIAAAQGATAALSINNYLKTKDEL